MQKKEKATMTPREFAAYTGFGQTATYKMLAAGEIPCIRVSSRFFIPRAAAEKWLESCGKASE
jgi:excisionase family DNA binding protein